MKAIEITEKNTDKPGIASALRIRLDKQNEDASGIGLIEWRVFADSAMRWAVGNGIIKGKTDDTILDPQGDTSRAETAILLVRYQRIIA